MKKLFESEKGRRKNITAMLGMIQNVCKVYEPPSRKGGVQKLRKVGSGEG